MSYCRLYHVPITITTIDISLKTSWLSGLFASHATMWHDPGTTYSRPQAGLCKWVYDVEVGVWLAPNTSGDNAMSECAHIWTTICDVQVLRFIEGEQTQRPAQHKGTSMHWFACPKASWKRWRTCIWRDLLLRIECMSFTFHSPNNPERSSSLNPVVARVARRCWRKNISPSHRYCALNIVNIVVKSLHLLQANPMISPVLPSLVHSTVLDAKTSHTTLRHPSTAKGLRELSWVWRDAHGAFDGKHGQEGVFWSLLCDVNWCYIYYNIYKNNII